MCGIAGYLAEPGRDERAALERMVDLLTHRGPDERGVFVGDGVGLACRRLAIVDVEGGQQPLRDAASGVTVAFNGEIYGFEGLRRELEGEHAFRTRCDTEVLLAGWLSWEREVFTRVDGMLACAIYDPRHRRIVLARDRFGQKPLFHARHDGVLWFASEIKALLSLPGMQRRIDRAAAAHYLLYETLYDPVTPFEGVFALPPAHLAVLSEPRSEPRPERYWSLPAAGVEARPAKSRAEAVEELAGLFSDAVRRRRVGDVPVGALLSGGLDSSAVCAELAAAADGTVDAFSIAPGDPRLDESGAQLEVAAHLGLRLSRYDAGEHSQQVLASYPEALWSGEYPDPAFEQDVLFRHLTAVAADAGYKVLLGGEGADELLRGYEHYRLYPEYMRMHREPDLGRVPRDFAADPDFFAEQADNEAASLDALGMPASLLRLLFPWEELIDPICFEEVTRELLRDPPGRPGVRLPPMPPFEGPRDGNDYLQHVELHTRLPAYILRTLDRYSMASSVEVRCPFLDHRLHEWFATLPARLRDEAPGEKRLLRDAVGGALPASIAARPKQGFRAPFLLTRSLRRPEARPALEALLTPAALESLGVDARVAGRLDGYARAPDPEDGRAVLWQTLLGRLVTLRMLQSVFVDDFTRFAEHHRQAHGVA